MKRQILELTLEKLGLEVTGGGGSKETTHVITVGLIWPRPAIAEKVAVKVLTLTGKSHSLAHKPWVERVLFKEKVEGPFGVELTVSEPLSDSQVMDFMRFAGSALFKMAASEAGDLMAGSLTTSLTRIPLTFLSKQISASSKKPLRNVANGTADLRAEDLLRHGRESTVKLRLRADEAVHRVTRRKKRGESTVRRVKLLDAGQPNGEAVLRARVY